MSVLKAIHFIGIFVGNFLDVCMAAQTTYPGMGPFEKQLLIDVKKPIGAAFIDSGQPPIPMAHQTIA